MGNMTEGTVTFNPKHIYTIHFKKTGKKVKDLTVAGYIDAAYGKLDDIKTTLVHYGAAPGYKNDALLFAVVKAEVVYDGKYYPAYGDGMSPTDVGDPGMLVRYAETRALKRALQRALNLSKADFEDCEGGSGEPDEEEGLPLQKNHGDPKPRQAGALYNMDQHEFEEEKRANKKAVSDDDW